MSKRKIPKCIILGMVLVSSMLSGVDSFSKGLPKSLEKTIASKFNDVNKVELEKKLNNKLHNYNKREKFIYPQKQEINKNNTNLNRVRLDYPKKQDNKNKKSTKVIAGKVLTVTLSDGQYISTSLKNNPEEYETIVVTTTGSKKLVKEDYDNLRLSKIPKVDLSNAWSDSIPSGAFSNATHLTEFKFPQGITSIEGDGTNANVGAFYNCKNLIGELIIPNSVTNIGNYAFRGCSGFTGSLTIPNSVTTIGNDAFYGCSGFNGSLTIPNSVTSIGNYAFSSCRGFTGSLTIGNSVTTIGNYTFNGCSGFTGNLTIPESVTTIGYDAFYGCSGFTGSLTIPNSVTSIGNYAFSNCRGFTGSLTIGNSVTTIGEYTFNGCSGFTGSLTIPNSITTIGQSAFSNCSGFTGSLTIPNSVTSIGNYAFSNCRGFTGSLTIPNSVTSIGNEAFTGCTGFNGSLTLSNSVTTIGEYAFYGCSGLTGYYIVPEHIVEINNAFQETNLKVIVKVSESDEDSNYKEELIKSSNIKNTYIDMPYEMSAGTWIKSSSYKLTTSMGATYGSFKNKEGILSYLEINAPYKESNITITKDGKSYNLPQLKNNKYTFEEEGTYTIKVVNDWGTVSNISFKNNVVIRVPEIQYTDGKVTIKDNGAMNIVPNTIIETFDDINDINDSKFMFERLTETADWYIEDGVFKSRVIEDNYTMAYGGFLIESEYEGSVKIRMKSTTNTSILPETNSIIVRTLDSDGNEIESIIDDGLENVGYFREYRDIELKIKEGRNILAFVCIDASVFLYEEPGQFMIDSIELNSKKMGMGESEILEYRIDGGEWMLYTGEFNLDEYSGKTIILEVRARNGENISNIVSKKISVEVSTDEINQKIEDLEQLKQESKLDFSHISDVRDMINNMPESTLKDLYQDRLNALIPDNILLDKKQVTSGIDIYLKPKEYLELSLNTNSIVFDEVDSTNDVIKEEAITLVVTSSSPYEVNSSLITPIENSDKTETLDTNILEIKTSEDTTYKPFMGVNNKINLLDNQAKGTTNTHKVDLKLNTNTFYKTDVYKTVIKFEINQK